VTFEPEVGAALGRFDLESDEAEKLGMELEDFSVVGARGRRP
jgi:hypothetical protein